MKGLKVEEFLHRKIEMISDINNLGNYNLLTTHYELHTLKHQQNSINLCSFLSDLNSILP